MPTIDPGPGGERLLTVRELAALWSTHPTTVRRAIKDGRLGVVRIGERQVRIPESAIAAYLARSAGVVAELEARGASVDNSPKDVDNSAQIVDN